MTLHPFYSVHEAGHILIYNFDAFGTIFLQLSRVIGDCISSSKIRKRFQISAPNYIERILTLR